MTRTVVFFSTKGGVGKTTIALNAAISLAAKKKRVLLLGLDLEAPLDAAKMCNLKLKKSMVDLIPLWDSVKDDIDALRGTFFVQVNPYLDFMPGILSLRTVSHLKAADVNTVLQGLKNFEYDFIIIDGGKNITDTLITIFDNAHAIFLVVTPDILSLYQTEWILDTVQSLGFPLSMIRAILNRSESRGSVSPSEIKMILPVQVFCQIPSEGRAAGMALNKANPVVLDSPHSRMSVALESLAASLLKDSIYITPRELSELRIKKETLPAEEEEEKSDMWTKLGLVEPLQEVKIERETDAIVSIKKKLHRQLVNEMNLKRLPVEVIIMDVEKSKKLRSQAEKIITNLLAKESGGFISSHEVRQKLIEEIVNEALGLGPLEELIKDASITEIMVNNKDHIYIERNGKLELTSKRFTSDTQVRIVMERILAPLGRRIDESSPYVDARLPDGSRVNAIIPPLSLTGPTLTIRKFAKQRLSIEDLISVESLNKSMASFLEACVRARKNILVSGGTGSGKTTFLNVLSEFIPDTERIITIEDSAELKLHHRHWIRLESRPPNIEGKGAIIIRDLFRNSLRMRPDRIIAGECRGNEVLDMLQAMNTGHDGSMTTIHANSTHDVIVRLDSMILMSGVELPLRAIREMVSSALDMIVHTSRMSDGSRKVIQITEVCGMLDETRINLQDIFLFKQTGISAASKVAAKVEGDFVTTGYIPTFFDEICAKGISLPKEIFSSTT